MASLREAMDRMFEETILPSRFIEAPAMIAFPVDVIEKEDAYEVKASLPGIKPEDVDITVTGNTVTIRGERKEEHEEKRANYLMRERRFGTCSRSITLPTAADAEHAQARFEHGILTLTIPKLAEAKAKHIKVQA
jgi:HSP20 family protein